MIQSSARFTSIGGQAVIEGVMMRSPRFVAVAVRRRDGKIVIRSSSYSRVRFLQFILQKPIFRGVITLIESMIQGMDALGYSAQVASDGEASESQGESELSSWAIAGSMITAFVMGMALFVALPHALTAWISSFPGIQMTAQDTSFHLIDGLIKILILLAYVYLISLMDDIRRVFQYHGAEHKSIYAFEAGEDLTVENARRHTTLHPRCGTSFLLILVLMSILIFSVVFPLFHLTELSNHRIFNHLLMIGVKIVLMLPVAGLAYEFIKVCAFRMDNLGFRILMWPGMLLQKLTTREPTDDQLEVALASLLRVLGLEKSDPHLDQDKTEIEIEKLSDLALVHASVAEFPEV